MTIGLGVLAMRISCCSIWEGSVNKLLLVSISKRKYYVHVCCRHGHIKGAYEKVIKQYNQPKKKRRRFGVVRTSDTEYSRWKNTEQKRTVSVALPAQIQKFWPLEILTLYFFPAPNSPLIFSSYHLPLNTISDSPKPLSISNKRQLIRAYRN